MLLVKRSDDKIGIYCVGVVLWEWAATKRVYEAPPLLSKWCLSGAVVTDQGH